jgi:lysophospholipase L1-like esterase
MNVLMMLLVIISFVLIDQVAVPMVIGTKIRAASDYRSPIHFQYGDVKALIDLINKDPNPKIITTGDSIINGGGVKNASDTIANYLQGDLRQAGSKYHVYNLGLSGANPGDIYFVVKSLHLTSQDVVVYDLNVSHYGYKSIIFPEITAELAPKYEGDQPLYDVLGIKKDKLEDRLQLLVDNTWKLYAYRDILSEMFKQKFLGKQTGKDYVSYDPWYYMDWSARTKGSPKRGGNDYPDTDPSLMFTKYMIQTVKKAGANVLIFNIPLNEQMMKRYDMLNRPMYDKNIARLSKFVTGYGAKFTDYEKLVPSPFFTDSLHPMKQGNQILAKQLQQDLAPWLDAKGGTAK